MDLLTLVAGSMFCDKEGNQFKPRCKEQCVECMRVEAYGELNESSNIIQAVGKILSLNSERITMAKEVGKFIEKGKLEKARRLIIRMGEITKKIDKIKNEF